MIVDRNDTDRSTTELIIVRAVCKLTFSVSPGEPLMATLRYYRNRCEDCPKTSYLGGDDLRRLVKVLEGRSSDENFDFFCGGSENKEPYIRFLNSDGKARFHSCHKDEAEFGHQWLSDFERRLLIAAAREVLACEKTTRKYLAGGGRLRGLIG